MIRYVTVLAAFIFISRLQILNAKLTSLHEYSHSLNLKHHETHLNIHEDDKNTEDSSEEDSTDESEKNDGKNTGKLRINYMKAEREGEEKESIRIRRKKVKESEESSEEADAKKNEDSSEEDSTDESEKSDGKNKGKLRINYMKAEREGEEKESIRIRRKKVKESEESSEGADAKKDAAIGEMEDDEEGNTKDEEEDNEENDEDCEEETEEDQVEENSDKKVKNVKKKKGSDESDESEESSDEEEQEDSSSDEDAKGRRSRAKLGVRKKTKCRRRSSKLARSKSTVAERDEFYELDLELAQEIRKHMDLTADPCNDFYQYACGSSENSIDQLAEMIKLNDIKVVQEMEKPMYKKSKSKFVRNALLYYENCLSVENDQCRRMEGVQVVKQLLQNVTRATGLQYTVVQARPKPQKLDPKKLGKMLGVLTSLGVDTLITLLPLETHGILASIGQPTLGRPFSFYFEAEKSEMDEYEKEIREAIILYHKLLKVKISNTAVKKNVKEIVRLEKEIARFYQDDASLSEEADATDAKRLSDRDTFASISIGEYFKGLTCGLDRKCPRKIGRAMLQSPDLLRKMMQHIAKKFSSTTIINYLFTRLLVSRREDLYDGGEECEDEEERLLEENDDIEIKRICLSDIRKDLPEFAERFEIDRTEELERAKILMNVRQIMQNTRIGLLGMARKAFANDLRSTLLLSKAFAEFKIDIKYPALKNDTKLDAEYRSLVLQKSDSFYAMREKLRQFKFRSMHTELFMKGQYSKVRLTRDKDIYFDSLTKQINLASLLMERPYYHPDWPLSVLYGKIGSIIGREVALGFEHAKSREVTELIASSYNEMATCVAEQFSEFYSLKKTGAQTKRLDRKIGNTEKIADSAGLNGAYAAYKQLRFLDQRTLPDSKLEKLTKDQLFFVGFAQNFCLKPPRKEELRKMLTHGAETSPNQYRIVGSIANVPEFREIFECESLSSEETSTVCRIWLPTHGNAERSGKHYRKTEYFKREEAFPIFESSLETA